MGASVSQALESVGVSPDELEVRHMNKGGDTYVAPVQLFKGKLPSKPPVLEDADRIPVDLRPHSDLAPWEQARAASARKGWDRTPWRPDPATASLSGAGGPRKRLRRIRGDDLSLGDGNMSQVEWDADDGALGEGPGSGRADDGDAAFGGESQRELLVSCLHGWRQVTAFSTGRTVPAKGAPAQPSSGRRGARGPWGDVARSFADGVAAAHRPGGDSDDQDDAPPDDDDGFHTAGDGRPSLRHFANRERPAPPPYVARALVESRRLCIALFVRGPGASLVGLLLATAICALLAAMLQSAQASLDAALDDTPYTALERLSPLLAAAAAGDAPGVHVALLQLPAMGGGSAPAHHLLQLPSPAPSGLLAASVRVSPLGVAAARNKGQALRALLATPGAEAAALGRCLGPACVWASITPLGDAAARLRSGPAIASLLGAGAPPGVGLRLGPWGLLARTPPLFLACARADGDAVAALLTAEELGDQEAALGGIPFAGLAWATARPLWAALASGTPLPGNLLPLLLTHGASPHRGAALGAFGMLAGDSPLAAAARGGAHGPVATLLSAGANPQGGTRLGPFALVAFASALGQATSMGHASAVAALLSGGAEVTRPGVCVGLACVFGSASPLFLAAASQPGRGGGAEQAGARSARAALLDALLRAHPGDTGRLHTGLRIGPWGLLATVSPLGVAAALDDVTSVARLLAAGAPHSHCARLLTVRLRCATSVAKPAAAAVLRDWANAQRADAAAMARAAAVDARQAQRGGRFTSKPAAPQPPLSGATAADRRAHAARAASEAGLARAQRSQAESAARRTTALVHLDSAVADDESVSAAAADLVSSLMASRGGVYDAPAAGGASGGGEGMLLDDSELRDIERWLGEQDL